MGKKILVIDDDEGILEAFDVMLTDAGYDVQISTDADPLRKLKKNNLPDLVLLDALLSGEDGRDICKWFKRQKVSQNIPVIMISAHPSASKSSKAAHADDFIAKPFEMDDLLEKVARLMNQ